MTATMTEFASADEGFSLISNRKLLSLYAAMLACRRIADMPRERLGENRAVHRASFLRGHEAAAVGAAIDLLPGDTVAPAVLTDSALMAINPGVQVAPSFALAVRAAHKNTDVNKITLLFSSRKRGSESSWLNALTLAGDSNLPVLFVSLDRPATPQDAAAVESIRIKRKGYAMPSICVDGNDVVAVYRVASESIAHARNGHGPTLIDCRLSSVGDPLEGMRNYLIGKGLSPGEFAA
jgi:TPP-dependent pyruvate/acetoin dehydrogenase alpha subunit